MHARTAWLRASRAPLSEPAKLRRVRRMLENREPGVDYKYLVQDDRIHASLYTDPRIFADEMERIFRRGWVFVGHDSEVPRPGDFVTRSIGGEPVIMVREAQGAVAILV